MKVRGRWSHAKEQHASSDPTLPTVGCLSSPPASADVTISGVRAFCTSPYLAVCSLTWFSALQITVEENATCLPSSRARNADEDLQMHKFFLKNSCPHHGYINKNLGILSLKNNSCIMIISQLQLLVMKLGKSNFEDFVMDCVTECERRACDDPQLASS